MSPPPPFSLLLDVCLTALLPPIPDHPNTMFLQPSEALFTGSADELSARFPDAPAHLVSLWLNNYEAENQELEEALGRHGLEAYCGEIERLFREGEPGLGMDDSMAE